MVELEYICLFVDLALWEEPPLQERPALHFAARELRSSTNRRRRKSSQPMETGEVRSLPALVGRATVVHVEQPSQSTGQWFDTGAGRPKKEEQRLKPPHRYLD